MKCTVQQDAQAGRSKGAAGKLGAPAPSPRAGLCPCLQQHRLSGSVKQGAWHRQGCERHWRTVASHVYCHAPLDAQAVRAREQPEPRQEHLQACEQGRLSKLRLDKPVAAARTQRGSPKCTEFGSPAVPWQSPSRAAKSSAVRQCSALCARPRIGGAPVPTLLPLVSCTSALSRELSW